MAEHPNAALVRKGFDAFAAGDLETLQELFSPDVVAHFGGDSAVSGDYKGWDELVGLFGKFVELAGGTLRNEVHDILADDDHAVALIRTKAERDGKTLDQNEVHVFHVADGRATEWWAIETDQAQGNAFWS